MKSRLRGFGRVFKRKNGGFAIAYYSLGQECRESVARALGRQAHEVTEQDAKALLEQRLGERREGTLILPRRELVTVADVLDNRIQTMRLRGRKGVKGVEIQSRKIAMDLGPTLPVRNLDSLSLKRWAERMLKKGFATGTVVLRLSNLRAAMKLAHSERLISAPPKFPTLELNNARQGFFEADQVEAILAALPAPVADVVKFAHLTGWRLSEITGLTWAQIDRQRAEIRLTDTKNGDGRVLPLVGDLAALIDRRWHERKISERYFSQPAVITPWVFHRKGRPIRDFRLVWRAALKAAGVEGRVFHDFRRTAARDLVDAGADYKTAMDILGLRSLAIFLRYRISDTKTSARALERLQEHRRLFMRTANQTPIVARIVSDSEAK